ncbi:IclR family transcriptional regulator [Microlunatus flavus]|uniref:IclR family transcriptional regulator n=1 Tax=Microlunatus flavus TaxID=1036181 RepID=UPI0018E0C32A|nr:IclR family transcriptional regulator [Microlunatus flavus]
MTSDATSSDEQPVTRASGVQSVERAFEILERIAAAGGEASLSDLASQTSLPLPTIHRMLRTLSGTGYVIQSSNRRYMLGPGLIRLGEVAHERLGLLARPELARLVDVLGETANMAVLDSDMVVYVAQVPSPHTVRMFTVVGRRVHVHDTGVGKAILAGLPHERVRAIVDRRGLPPATPRSIATMAALEDDLERIRAVGYAVDDEEQEIGVRCYAMAVPGTPLPTAISVSGPGGRVDAAFGERAVPELRRAVERLSSVLTRGVVG